MKNAKNFLLTYSNGWGHLIMSIITLAAGLYLLSRNITALGSTLIGVVVSAWFVPNAARQVAEDVNNNVSSSVASIFSDVAANTVQNNQPNVAHNPVVISTQTPPITPPKESK